MINIGGTWYRLHPLFVLLMVFSILTGYFIEMLTLFGVVLIHELGHVAAAKSYGWRVRAVKLLPFGGVAEVEEGTNVQAREELVVALFGPIQNLWMACFAWFMLQLGANHGEYWTYFLQANVMIGCFNLLPVLPLDGGKIVQAGLSYLTSYHRTLTVCAGISLFLSLAIMIAAGIRTGGGLQLNLLLIGSFLFASNWFGYKQLPFAFLRFLVNREQRWVKSVKKKAEAMPLIVTLQHKPMDVFRMFMREKYHYIYVLEAGGKPLRMVPEEELLRAYFAEEGSRGSHSLRHPPLKPPKIG